LREIVRLSATTGLKAGNDYVLIGRRAGLEIPFVKLTADFAGALKRLEKKSRTGVAGAAGKAPHTPQMESGDGAGKPQKPGLSRS
jgi:RNase P protein component